MDKEMYHLQINKDKHGLTTQRQCSLQFVLLRTLKRWLISFAFILFAKRSRVTKYLLFSNKQTRNLSIVKHIRHAPSFTLHGLCLNLIDIIETFYLKLWQFSQQNVYRHTFEIDLSTVVWLFNELEQNKGFLCLVHCTV